METNFSKNSCFDDDRSFWPIFPRMIECNKPLGTIIKGPEAILTGTVELKGACFRDLRGCWKHKFLEKRASSPVKKMFWPFFSRNIEQDKRQRTTYKGTQGNLTSLVQATCSFLQDLRSREPTFSKKRLSSRWQKNLAYFFFFYRVSQATGDLF